MLNTQKCDNTNYNIMNECDDIVDKQNTTQAKFDGIWY